MPIIIGIGLDEDAGFHSPGTHNRRPWALSEPSPATLPTVHTLTAGEDTINAYRDEDDRIDVYLREGGSPPEHIRPIPWSVPETKVLRQDQSAGEFRGLSGWQDAVDLESLPTPRIPWLWSAGVQCLATLTQHSSSESNHQQPISPPAIPVAAWRGVHSVGGMLSRMMTGADRQRIPPLYTPRSIQ